ncbi:MAG: MFS transporter [Ilumatobacteraceae bacterium]
MSPAVPLTRLARVHGYMAAGDTFLAVSLADSLFLSISPDAARSKVLLFLALSLAPFAILAPLVGPYIDRLPGGRRLTVFFVGWARAVVVIFMIGRIHSLLLFPLAFISLVLAKIYAVSRSSLVPTLVSSDDELVAANGKLGLVVGVVSIVAVIPAGLAHLIGSGVSLAIAALLFAMAGVMALKLPKHIATVGGPAHSLEREELHKPQVTQAALAMVLLRAAVGFMFFHLAFWLRHQSAGTAWFGLAIGLASLATMLANGIAPIFRRRIPEQVMLGITLVVMAVVGIATGYIGGITAGIVLSATINGVAAIGRLSFEAIVQASAPDADRARAFVQFETRNQLAWVFGGLIAVIAVPPGAVGFALVGVTGLVGSAYFIMRTRSLNFKSRQP